MKALGSIPLALLIFCLNSCVSVSPEMKRLVEQDIPSYIQAQVENKKYLFESQTFMLHRDRLQKWLVEELKLDKYGDEIYEEKYKNKKESLIATTNSQIDHDLYDPSSAYDFTVKTCGGWQAYMHRRNQLTAGMDTLSLFDQNCYRLIRIEAPRVYAYDLIILINKNENFISESESVENLLITDLRHLGRDGSIFRMAKFVEPNIKFSAKIINFALLQFSARRYFARSGILHADIGRKRVLDTYILMLTGKKVKVIIQTFYSAEIEANEIEQDLKSILGALTIK